MIIKLIRVVTHKEHRQLFAKGQRAWATVREHDGFAGQLGGWSDTDQNEAWILTVWLSAGHYERFMSSTHDKLYAASAQQQAIATIKTTLFATRATIHGCASHACRALNKACELGLDVIKAKPGKADALLAAQQRIWNPALATVPGLLAGCFGQATTDLDAYLVALLWESSDAARRFETETRPQLREQAHLSDYCRPILKRRVQLIKDWCVPAPQLV